MIGKRHENEIRGISVPVLLNTNFKNQKSLSVTYCCSLVPNDQYVTSTSIGLTILI